MLAITDASASASVAGEAAPWPAPAVAALTVASSALAAAALTTPLMTSRRLNLMGGTRAALTIALPVLAACAAAFCYLHSTPAVAVLTVVLSTMAACFAAICLLSQLGTRVRAAAVNIQRTWRGAAARIRLKEDLLECFRGIHLLRTAATTIAAAARGRAARVLHHSLVRLTAVATTIAAFARGRRTRALLTGAVRSQRLFIRTCWPTTVGVLDFLVFHRTPRCSFQVPLEQAVGANRTFDCPLGYGWLSHLRPVEVTKGAAKLLGASAAAQTRARRASSRTKSRARAKAARDAPVLHYSSIWDLLLFLPPRAPPNPATSSRLLDHLDELELCRHSMCINHVSQRHLARAPAPPPPPALGSIFGDLDAVCSSSPSRYA